MSNVNMDLVDNEWNVELVCECGHISEFSIAECDFDGMLADKDFIYTQMLEYCLCSQCVADLCDIQINYFPDVEVPF